MPVTTVNGCVAIPEMPNWKTPPEVSESVMGRMSMALHGEENREQVRKTPIRMLRYLVSPKTQPERSRLEDRVSAAIKLGNAAVPYWGRGQRLDAACSTTALTLTTDIFPIAAGDWIYLRDPEGGPEDWEMIEVESVSGVDVTLADTPARTYPEGSYCWPVLFGSLSVGSVRANESYRGDFQLTLLEPIGSGSLLDNTSCPAAPADYTFPTVDYCEGSVVLSLTPGEVCGDAYDLTWTEFPFATGYLLKVADNPGGPYATIETFAPEEREHTVARAYLADKYYVVCAVVGDFTTDPSNEKQVPGRFIEAAMRAIQERIESANEPAVTWPGRSLPSASATADYPEDGWYAEDIENGGISTEVSLIQAIFDALTDTVLSHYTPGVEGLAHDATIPYYQRGQVGTPFATLPLTVDSGNRVSSLALVETICCSLSKLNQDANYTLIEDRNGLGGDGTFPADGANGTPAEALFAARVDYDANSFVDLTGTPGSTLPGIHGSILSSDPLSPGGERTWSSYLVTSRFKLGGDWTGYGDRGRLYLLLAVSPGNGPAEHPHSVVAGNLPPVFPSGQMVKATSYSMPQTTIETDYYGDGIPETPEADQTRGWYLRRAMWLLEKSPIPADEEWQYFP